MFREIIKRTAMTSAGANNYFQDVIVGGSWEEDFSFLSTLRALVYPRMKDGDRVKLTFSETNFTKRDTENHSAERIVKAIYYDSAYQVGNITVHSIIGNESDTRCNFEAILKGFTKVYPEWYRIENITNFYRKQFYTLCYVNPDNKKVVLFVDRMDIRKMHYLQCSILAFMPWYFDPKQGVSEVEMNLIESLREKSSDKYKECIEKIAEESHDFRSETIRKLLAGFETRLEVSQREKTIREISSIDSKIDDLDISISRLLQDRREKEIKLLGLNQKINQTGDSEIMGYFLNNQYLRLDEVNDCYMIFVVESCCEYFDEDVAISSIENQESCIYITDNRSHNEYVEDNDMKRLMYEIFINHTLKLRFCSAYKFNLRDQRVEGLQKYNYGVTSGYMPNPHIDEYSCMGNYDRIINTMLKDYNYIGAIEQCIASCKSLNFGDSIVMQSFMDRMYGTSSRYDNKCIELPNGTIVTPKDAIEWLKEQEGTNE